MPIETDNAALTARARAVMPGGLLSPSRQLAHPYVFVRAAGPYLYDADGNEHVDYHCGFGANMLGHCAAAVRDRVTAVSERIDLIGAAALDLEIEAAETLVRLIPCADQVAFCNSGSEATYHALRLARDPDRIGQYDPVCDGILLDAARHTVVLPYNDAQAVEDYLSAHPGEVAAVIIEPIAHNMGSVVAHDAFLRDLRRLTADHGTVLIFDEVITGFRHALGGYQSIVGVTPDLATFGKAVASGHPVGILAGRADLMERLGRTGQGAVFMGGTFNGTPPSLAALLATIGELERPGTYERLFALGDRMRNGLSAIVERLGIPAQPAGYGSVWLLYFFQGAFQRYEDLLRNDNAADLAFRRRLVEQRFIFQPLPLKRLYLSTAHDEALIDRTLGVIAETLHALPAAMRVGA